ncbi:MAG: DMT family transporter, partial [Rhizobiaceae bacterium]|nr:DMT family transporter [Rhizobiaceae bacterium]
FYDMPWQLQITTGSLAALITLGLIATALGNYLRFEIVDRQGATFLAQNNYMMPLFGIFWAWVILSEQPPANALFALLLILLGVAIVRWAGAKARVRQ